MTSSTLTQPTSLRIFRTTAVLGLVCGALDVAFAILRRAQSFEDLQLVFPSVYATAVVVAAAFLLAWILLGGWLCRRWQLAPAALATALAVAFGTTFVSARIGEFSLRDLSADAVFMFGLYALGGAAGGTGNLPRRRCAQYRQARSVAGTGDTDRLTRPAAGDAGISVVAVVLDRIGQIASRHGELREFRAAGRRSLSIG